MGGVKSGDYRAMTSLERRKLREAYAIDQGGACQHCGLQLTVLPNMSKPIRWSLFPGGREGFLRYPVHLHHSHKTGMTIGAVHAYCNAVLWQYHGE